MVKSQLTALEGKKGGRSPATGGSSKWPAPGRPLVGEGQGQEANEETTRLRSQRIFIKRQQSYWEEAMMLDTPVEKRRGDQHQCEKNGR